MLLAEIKLNKKYLILPGTWTHFESSPIKTVKHNLTVVSFKQSKDGETDLTQYFKPNLQTHTHTHIHARARAHACTHTHSKGVADDLNDNENLEFAN